MTDPARAPDPGPYAAAAPAYWRASWSPLPLPHGRKKPVPDGWTGNDGAWPSYADVQAWVEDRGAGNVALRMPPNVLGIDVDHYGDKPGGLVLTQLETTHGPLPATWRVTSRDDGTSGIRFYRIPEGLRWPGVLGPGIETIRHGHRYAVAWPSIHPDTGNVYRWITPDGATTLNGIPNVDDLPALPQTWVDALTHGDVATDQPRADLTDAGTAEWLTARAGGHPCRVIDKVLNEGLTSITAGGSRHDAALALTNRIVWLAGEGHPGTGAALTTARTAFEAATAERVEAGEWVRMVAGAVRLAAPTHPDPVTVDPCHLPPFADLLIKEQPCPTTTPTTPPPSAAPTPTTGTNPPTTTPSTSTATPADEPAPDPASWAHVDLTPYLDGTYTAPQATLFTRTDGISLLYPGLVHSFHGESESGKSMLAQIEAVRLLAAGEPVLYIDFESDAASVVERLIGLGATPTTLHDHLDYRRPEINPNITAAELQAWTQMLAGQYTLAVIDGVTDSLGMFGYSLKENDDIAKWMRILPKQVAHRTGAAVVIIDHVTKDSESRGRFAIGGQAKMSGLDGAAYTVDVIEALGRGLKGIIALRVAKDRPGYVRGNSGPMRKTDRTQESARIVIDSTGPQMTVSIDPPAGLPVEVDGHREHRPFRLTGLMESVSKRLEGLTAPASQTSVEKLVGAKADRVRAVLRTLLDEGFVTVESGARGALLYTSTRPYRQHSDPESELYRGVDDLLPKTSNTDPVPPRPTPSHRVPDGVNLTASPVPYPVGDGDAVKRSDDTSTASRSGHVIDTVVAGRTVKVDMETGEVVE